MIPFEETIKSKEELIAACKKGFEDYSNKKISIFRKNRRIKGIFSLF